ncbi:Vegetative incompatibility protein HET-E-1 [Colletotrichum fructicola]|nr:Vegetative incompatibility protein HET-E-1 [Colletotrichum fructicola]
MATRYDISNPGLGSQCNNTGFGTQNNNAGSGNQYNAELATSENGDAKLLADLWVTDPRHDKTRIERRKGGLLRDSYRWILDHEAFVRWQADTQSSLLWIRGDPGKGKTMLICGIIDELPARMPGWQTIYFFCEATDSRLNNATAVLRSLLYLLLRNRPSLSKFIREEHAHAGRRLFEDANGWDVLEETFTKIAQDGGLKDFILIIDALDECRTGLGQLLDVIVRLSSLKVKVIASSRNWLSIEETILDVSDQVCISLELNEKSISAAVNRYICHKVDQLASRKKYDISTRNYIYDHLSSKADDTFLWVALVTDQLGKPGVSERHARIKVEEFPRKLNSLYERMLERTWESNDRDRCKRILAVVSIVYRPVTLLELMSLAELEEFRAKTEILEEIVGECGSLLTVKDGIVYFVHQSAKDFISGHALAEVMPFGIHHEHNLLLSRSLEVMYKTCRRNIYDLQEPRESLDDIRTPVPDPLGPARYACAYWLEHISDGGHLNEQQYSQVYDFLEQHFLHWIEALSLLKSMSGGIASLFKFARAIQASVMSEQKLFIQDALRFIRYFRVAVESWPLEVYSSALVFSPTQSIIRKKFESEIADWIIKKPVVDDEWSPCLQTLEGHELEVRFLLSAPDGITLASASIDKTVKLWDTITGECLRTLRGHEARVESLAFSLKGEMLASVSKDAVVKLWNMATGGLLNTFHGTSRSGIILSPKLHVSFCGGDKHVALGSREIVEIWDTATGQLVRQFMCEGLHAIAATEVAFSADGALW